MTDDRPLISTAMDTTRTVTLWGLPTGLSLVFSEAALADNGIVLDDTHGSAELLAEIFRCKVTITEVNKTTAHYHGEVVV